MDLQTRLDCIRRVGEEIITEREIWTLLETSDHQTARRLYISLRSVESTR